MPKRALIEHRPWLLVSIIASVAYYLLDQTDSPLGEIWIMLVKGAGVAALAIYALARGPGSSAKHIALVLALCAIADMVLELYFQFGAGIFALAHLVAIALYIRFPRHHSTGSQKALAGALAIGTPFIAWLLTNDIFAAAYGLTLGAMAAAAWMSRFPRYRVGIGAVLFVISDILIFARMGIEPPPALANLLIWPLYYVGQFMIATGVVQTLRHELSEED
ncbi:lysoplasmalogenase [Altererythrobacter lutimaris]|uniref:Lysoplasmalogenase n=1 Tax=Altererythrobacter lutimaris TaxID=2743979 RepID=A0A850H915_9SPHN|nr:lysoplasmalogenase [Altererythrobacter lutimaris]NVE94000.1 lysoplasmalogenase [Altererythrobacter lutimaris]